MSGVPMKVGVTYEDAHREMFPTEPERSPMRKALDKAVVQALDADVFDRLAESAIKALAVALDLHQPWFNWEQQFKPTYVGDKYLGVTCRACDNVPAGQSDCWTVQEIAKQMGLAA